MNTKNKVLFNFLHHIKLNVINYAVSKWYDIITLNNMDYGTLSTIYNNDLWINYKQQKFFSQFKHLIVWQQDRPVIENFISPIIPEHLFIDLINWNKYTILHQTGKDLLLGENIDNPHLLFLTTISTILDSISWNQFNIYLDQYYNIHILK